MHLIVDNSAAPLPPVPRPLAGAFTERRSSPAFGGAGQAAHMAQLQRLHGTAATAIAAAEHDGYWRGHQAGYCEGWYWGLAFGVVTGGAIVALALLAGRHAA